MTTNAGNAVGAVFYQASLPTAPGSRRHARHLPVRRHRRRRHRLQPRCGRPGEPDATDQHRVRSVVTSGTRPTRRAYPGTAGMPYGYLGIGLDVYGNYENTPLAGGTGCTTPSPLVNNLAYPELVTTRGPGNGTVGYCILGTTATVSANSSGGGSHNGTITNVGTGHRSTTRPPRRGPAIRSRSRSQSTHRHQPPRQRAGCRSPPCRGSSPTHRSGPRRSRRSKAPCRPPPTTPHFRPSPRHGSTR